MALLSNTSSNWVQSGAALVVLRDLHRPFSEIEGPFIVLICILCLEVRFAQPDTLFGLHDLASLGRSGAVQRGLRPLVRRSLGSGVAHRGRASGSIATYELAAALPKPAPGGRVPARRAAGELTLPCNNCVRRRVVRCLRRLAEVDLHDRGQVTGSDQCEQDRDRRGLEAGVVAAWWIVAAELGAEVDEQPGPRAQEPVTAQSPLGPDGPHDLLVDYSLKREPGHWPNIGALAALAPDPLAGQLQLGAVADCAGGGHCFLVAAPHEHVLAGQGGRVGEGRGRAGALGRLLDVSCHRYHQLSSSRATRGWV